MASPVNDNRPLKDLSDWELVARKTAEADAELKRQCYELAVDLCGWELAEGRLRPKQNRLIDEMKQSGDWIAEMERRGDPGKLNTPDDLALTFSWSAEAALRERLFAEIKKTARLHQSRWRLSEVDLTYVVEDTLWNLRIHLRDTLTEWLLDEDRTQEGGTACCGYACRAAINRANSFLTANPIRRASSLSAPDESDRVLEVPDPDDHNGKRTEEILVAQNELAAASLLMPRHYWDILRLRDLEEREFPDIAEILGISVGAARARHMHARHRLREIIEEMRSTSNAR